MAVTYSLCSSVGGSVPLFQDSHSIKAFLRRIRPKPPVVDFPQWVLFTVFGWRPLLKNVEKNCRIKKEVQSGLSSRAKHGGPVFSAVSGYLKYLTTVPGSYNHLGP